MTTDTWWTATAPCGCITSAALDPKRLRIQSGDTVAEHSIEWAGLARCEQHKTPKDN